MSALTRWLRSLTEPTKIDPAIKANKAALDRLRTQLNSPEITVEEVVRLFDRRKEDRHGPVS